MLLVRKCLGVNNLNFLYSIDYKIINFNMVCIKEAHPHMRKRDTESVFVKKRNLQI